MWFRGWVQRCGSEVLFGGCGSEGVVQGLRLRGCDSDDVVHLKCVYCPWFAESCVLTRKPHAVCGCSHAGNLVPLKYSHT